MDSRVSQYLEIVPLPAVALIPLALFIGYILIPQRLRLDVFLVLMVLCLTIGRLPGLGIVQALAKVGGFGTFTLVLLAALLDPYPKRRLAGAAFLYPVLAAYAFIFIITVSGFFFAFVLRAQWLVLVLAAVAVARTITDHESLMRILRAMTVGMCIALLVTFAALVRDPGSAFRAGLGRFEPWGAPSNQIGIFFGLAAPLCIVMSWYARRLSARYLFFGFAMIAVGLCVLTASRSAVAVMAVTSFPIALQYLRRPFFLVAAGVMAALGLTWIIGFSEPGTLDRLTSFETGRAETAQIYVDVAISERPIAGLLQTRDASILSSEAVGKHPHNAYVETAYLGGAMYSLPMFAMIALTAICTMIAWRRRHWLPYDPLLITTLAAIMMMVYAHGFVNGSIYYPTYTWAFVHIMVSTLFLSFAADLRRGDVPSMQPELEYAEEHTDYDVDPAHGFGMAR